MLLRRALWFFPTLLVVIALVVLPAKLRADVVEAPMMGALKPIQTQLTELVPPLAGLSKYFSDVSALEAERRRLEGEVARLTSDVARLKETESENKRLRELLSYQGAHPEWQFLGADIISRDPSNLVQSAILDKGSKDGVAEGMTVIAGGSLAGRITKVFETSSKMLFITDSSSAVNAMIQRSRVLGVIKGKIGNRLVMDYLRQDDDIQMRDLIITSGMGGGFPKGLPIGYAVGVRGRDVEPFLQVEVEPIADFRSLESVIIILNFSPVKL